MKNHVICIDLGATNTRVAILNSQGTTIKHKKSGTPNFQANGELILEYIFEEITQVVKGDLSQIVGVGIGVPATVDPVQGVIYEACNLPAIEKVNVKEFFQRKLGLPTHIGNDANLATLGEYKHGLGQGLSNFVYLTLSTGIGGGIVANQQLVLGVTGLAGEFGEISFGQGLIDGELTNNRKLEDISSGASIARRVRKMIKMGRQSDIMQRVSGDLEKVTAQIVFESASDNDLLATEIIETSAYYIGLAIANILHILNPERIVLGGSMVKSAKSFIGIVTNTVMSHSLPSIANCANIVISNLDDQAVLLGAKSLVLGELEKN